MARRRRAPTTQLARAGERTIILVGDEPVPEIRFRATTLTGEPRGRIEIETGEALPRTAALVSEVRLDAAGLVRLSVIPEADTAITFLPVERPTSPAYMVLGGVLLLGAVGWTIWDYIGGG